MEPREYKMTSWVSNSTYTENFLQMGLLQHRLRTWCCTLHCLRVPGICFRVVRLGGGEFQLLARIDVSLIHNKYMHMDSDRYPLRDFGQAFFRVYGQPVRHVINILQSLQMFMLVAVLVLSNGGAISQVSIGDNGIHGNGLCYIVCMLIFAFCGMALGQIRTLQRFGWLANFSVWTTVCCSFLAAIYSALEAHPNYTVMLGSFGSGGVPFGATNFPDGTIDSAQPIRKFAGSPPPGYASGGAGFLGTYQGINTIIYAYGGAMLFFNLLAEMRNPWDFWKGMLCADIFIYIVYMFFGSVSSDSKHGHS